MAEQFGLDELRAAALNTVGGARVHLGEEEQGLADTRLAVEVAAAANSPFELSRAKGNLASHLWLRGKLAEAAALWEEAHDETTRYGQFGFSRWFRGVLADKHYALGRWDEALALADPFVAELEAGSPHYLGPQVYLTRAFVHLGRAEDSTVLSDAEQALTLARRAKDPQILYGALANAAHVHRELGDRRKASELAREFLTALEAGAGIGFSVSWIHVLSWTLADAGAGPELAAALAGDPLPWSRAAVAFAQGDPVRAAEVCAEMGAVSEEAYARLAAARLLVDQGRRAEADEQLQRALGFYRSVGARRYIGQAEALLAAAS
jgi:tetratricopeptide (TPR) repeat protein